MSSSIVQRSSRSSVRRWVGRAVEGAGARCSAPVCHPRWVLFSDTITGISRCWLTRNGACTTLIGLSTLCHPSGMSCVIRTAQQGSVECNTD